MDAQDLGISGVRLLVPARHGDSRGFFSETYNQSLMASVGIDVTFVQDNHSLSELPGTVRGLHMQAPPHAQDKLVRVVKGAILDVAVDVRVGSPTFGRHVTAEISSDNWAQIFVPKGFLHGFMTLEPDTEVIYKVSDYYNRDAEAGVIWNDPALGINWPSFPNAPVTSGKDKLLPGISDFNSPFTYTDAQ